MFKKLWKVSFQVDSILHLKDVKSLLSVKFIMLFENFAVQLSW